MKHIDPEHEALSVDLSETKLEFSKESDLS